MESASESGGSQGAKAILRSPTVIFALVLVAVYIIIGAIVGNFFEPLLSGNIILDLLVQCDAPTPIFPWTVLTAIFLHASILHIASNIFFLLFFGFILEEQVSKSHWVMTFFITGLVGSLGFVAYDMLGFLLSGGTPIIDCAVGASGAVYGIMGTAVGLKVVILLIFLLGLDIFAGGGGPAHLGGLVAGLVLRRYWKLGGGSFRGI
ncbi:rhomboid family intramembrane serine protease [Candidatus Bathyarchaeota archaeon]|nr:MAG: rhomboid family intramembrane serine protease [Candidatus Bathyarchaeota archaeon]TMI74961.1 MAG: rhomboid family intramembrane serine protease [Candidatus Bathyarchaeota archaeon]